MSAKDIRVKVSTKNAAPPGGTYSQGIIANGLVYTAGCGPNDPEGRLVGDNIADQTRQVLHNLSAILAEAGSSLSDVVKVTTHLAEPARDFAGYDAVCREIFPKPYPVRTTVGSHLVGILVEIDVVAVAHNS
jgi:2-iminobutanoate/2-iminopropanoate deaminase